MIRTGHIFGILAVGLAVGCNFETQAPDIGSFSVAGPLSTDTASVAIEGTLHSSTAPLSVSWKVLHDAEDFSGRFRIDFTPPGASSIEWDLAEQGHARLRNLSAPVDTYTLVATLVDGDGVTTVRSTDFEVATGCGSPACDLPLPAPVTLQGLGTQESLYSALSIQGEVIDRIEVATQTPGRTDLLLRWEVDHLELVSPAADSALDSRVAAWTVLNRTLIVPSEMAVTDSTTPREVLAQIQRHAAQSATIQMGTTYLVQCADGSVGWLRVESITGTGIASSLAVTFSVARVAGG